jgi:hypothetical protein
MEERKENGMCFPLLFAPRDTHAFRYSVLVREWSSNYFRWQKRDWLHTLLNNEGMPGFEMETIF